MPNQTPLQKTNALRFILTQSDDDVLKYLIKEVLGIERDISVFQLTLANVVERVDKIKGGIILYHNNSFLDDNDEDIIEDE